jgi:hypothetical protein
MTDHESLIRFLSVVNTARFKGVPPVWAVPMRQALSDHLIRVGWGGVLELTDAGRAKLKDADK